MLCCSSYLVVALGVQAVVVLTVLVGAVDVATVLTARKPEEKRGSGQAPFWVPGPRRTLPGPKT